MRIKIKTASKEADLAVVCTLKNEFGQIVVLTYSAGLYIMLEYIGANILSPLFPVDDAVELEKVLKLNNLEKDVVLNVEVERLSEEDTIKILSHEIYSVYYKKKEKFFDLIKFESEALEASNNLFFQNFNPNLLVMQPVDVEENFELDSILERIQKVGIKNITKLEKDFLERISKQQ